jgi:hypothetical protein
MVSSKAGLAWSFEFLHQCHQSKKEIIVLKLDFTKAFDMIEHDAIISMLKQYGLDDRFIGWLYSLFWHFCGPSQWRSRENFPLQTRAKTRRPSISSSICIYS